MDEELTIADVVRTTGLTAHTLRYYERAGLLAPIARNGGGHRRYRHMDVNSLLFLIRLRMTGMPIHQVREYAELARCGEETVEARRVLLQNHRSNVEARIAELQGNLAILDYKIGMYERGWSFTTADDPCLAQLRELCQNTDAVEQSAELINN